MSDDTLGTVRTLPQPLPDAVVRYAPHEDGLVDVHLPAGAGTRPAPLVVLLHGGFWRQAYDRTHTRPVAGALAAQGCVVATPEYRRVGGAGGWPATAEDVELALAAVPWLLAGLGIAVSGLTVVGHSAGGHLALWLANQPHRIDRVVGLAPVGDLRAAADPATRFARRPGCEVVVVHGEDDDVVPLANSRGLAAAHPFVDLRPIAGADHFAVMDPTSPTWSAEVGAVCG